MQLTIISLIFTSLLHAASGAPTSPAAETDTKTAVSANTSAAATITPSAAADQKSASAAAAYQPAVSWLRSLMPASNSQASKEPSAQANKLPDDAANKISYALAKEDLAQTPFADAILEGKELEEALNNAKTPLQKVALSPSVAAKELKKLYAAVWKEMATPDLTGKTWQDSRTAIDAGTARQLPPPLIAIISEYAHTKPIETIFENVVASEVNDWENCDHTQEALCKAFFPEMQHPVEHPNSFHKQFGQKFMFWPLSRELLLEKCKGWLPGIYGFNIAKALSPLHSALDALVCPSCQDKCPHLPMWHFGTITNVFFSWKKPQFYHHPSCDLYTQPSYAFGMTDKEHLQNMLLRLDIFTREIFEKQNPLTPIRECPQEAQKAYRWSVYLHRLNVLLLTMPKCALIRDNKEKFVEQEKERGLQQGLLKPSSSKPGIVTVIYKSYVTQSTLSALTAARQT